MPQAYLPKAREFHTTLNCTKYRLQVLKSSFSNLDLRKEHSNGDDRLGHQSRVSDPVRSGSTLVQNGVSDVRSQGSTMAGVQNGVSAGVGANQLGVNGSVATGNKVYVEMVITPYGPELASIDYNQLTENCEAALRRADQYVAIIVDLFTRVTILLTFYAHMLNMRGRYYVH